MPSRTAQWPNTESPSPGRRVTTRPSSLCSSTASTISPASRRADSPAAMSDASTDAPNNASSYSRSTTTGAIASTAGWGSPDASAASSQISTRAAPYPPRTAHAESSSADPQTIASARLPRAEASRAASPRSPIEPGVKTPSCCSQKTRKSPIRRGSSARPGTRRSPRRSCRPRPRGACRPPSPVATRARAPRCAARPRSPDRPPSASPAASSWRP